MKQHKARGTLAKQIATQPFVLAHSPTKRALDWNVEKTDRLHIEPSYESSLVNLRYLKNK